MDKISVIIPYMQESRLLSKTIESILGQHSFDVAGSCEILVVNAAKQDLGALCAQRPFVKEIPCDADRTEQAIAVGLSKADGAWTAVFNCGDTVSDRYFADLRDALRVFPDVPFAVCKAFCVNPALLQTKPSVLNGAWFDKLQRVDVRKTPEAFITSLCGGLFKTEVLKEYGFRTNLKYEAIIDFVLTMLSDHPVYAVSPSAEYYYFMPQEDDFLYHIPANHADWYTQSVQDFLLPLLERYKGNIPLFIQVYAMYFIQSRFLSNQNNRNKRNMTKEELAVFFDAVKQALEKLDDAVIFNKDKYSCLKYSLEAGQTFIYLKNGYPPCTLPYTYVEGKEQVYLSYNHIHVTTVAAQPLNIHVMDYRNGKVFIDGSFREILNNENVRLFALWNGKMLELQNNDRYSLTKYFGIAMYKKFTFHLDLELGNGKPQTLQFFARVKQTDVPLRVAFINHWAKLCQNPDGSYWRFRDKIAFYDKCAKAIVFQNATTADTFKRECKFLMRTFKQSKRSFALRCCYWLSRPYFKHKKIWYLYDKMYKGGDSCEYLYRYCKDKNDGVTRYYVIDQNTSDYRNLKKDGFKPVKNKTLFAKLAFLNADTVLITNANAFPFNGFSMDYSRFIRGLCNFQTMCLQHGLSVQKCAMAQQRIVDNTVRYFVGSKYEIGNLEHHAYNYKGFDIIKPTGIARYDGLKSNDQKQILLSPTWRMYNAMPVTTSEGEQRSYNPEYKHTLYFKIYNDLINNEKLIDCAKRTGYTIKYLLHPIVSAQAKDYTPNSAVEVIPSVGDLSYEKILTESSLMVTDYSGVQFDFAYMKKPLVYFHPSALPAHYEDGCFFYDTMGFGEICTESEQLVDLLCEYMETGCKMKQKYIDRVDDFYLHHDHENCKRIYEEVLAYQQQIDKDKMRN